MVTPPAERRPQRGPGAAGRRSDRGGAVVERPSVRDRMGGDVDGEPVERDRRLGLGQWITPEARLEVHDAGPVEASRAATRGCAPAEEASAARSTRRRAVPAAAAHPVTRTAARSTGTGAPSRGVAVSSANVPTCTAPGGSGASPSTRYRAGRRALHRADLHRRHREVDETGQHGDRARELVSGSGPRTRRTGRSWSRAPTCRETRSRVPRAGSPAPGKVPAPRSAAVGAHGVGSELASAGDLRCRRRGEPDDRQDEGSDPGGQAPHPARRGVAVAVTRTARSPSGSRTPSRVNASSPRTTTVTASRSACTSTPRSEPASSWRVDVRAGPRLGERGFQLHHPALPVRVLVDRRRARERSGVGGVRQRSPRREAAPEIDGDATQREEQHADAEQPERDRAPLTAVRSRPLTGPPRSDRRVRGGAPSTTTRPPRRAPGTWTAGICDRDLRLHVAPRGQSGAVGARRGRPTRHSAARPRFRAIVSPTARAAPRVTDPVARRTTGDLPSDDTCGDLTLRPPREGQHQQRDGQDQQRDAAGELGGDESRLRPTTRRASVTAPAPSPLRLRGPSSRPGMPGIHPARSTRARARIAPSASRQVTRTAPGATTPSSTLRARRRQSAAVASTAAPVRAPSSTAARATPRT